MEAAIQDGVRHGGQRSGKRRVVTAAGLPATTSCRPPHPDIYSLASAAAPAAFPRSGDFDRGAFKSTGLKSRLERSSPLSSPAIISFRRLLDDSGISMSTATSGASALSSTSHGCIRHSAGVARFSGTKSSMGSKKEARNRACVTGSTHVKRLAFTQLLDHARHITRVFARICFAPPQRFNAPQVPHLLFRKLILFVQHLMEGPETELFDVAQLSVSVEVFL